MPRDEGFEGFFRGFPPFGGWGRGPWEKGFRKGRRQVFESGELKFVILRLLKEKPRHGYEVMKAMEEQLGGCYTPSAGSVYPTLQMLEDQGHVRSEEIDGKKVYHITPEGERFLEENRDLVDEILDRVREAFDGVIGGAMPELGQALGRVAKAAYRGAWQAGPRDERTRRIVEVLRKTAEEIEGVVSRS